MMSRVLLFVYRFVVTSRVEDYTQEQKEIAAIESHSIDGGGLCWFYPR